MEYLGSVALSRQSSDLMALQQPLTQLYMKYLTKDDDANIFARTQRNGDPPITLPGSIEISKTGLKVRTLILLCKFFWNGNISIR